MVRGQPHWVMCHVCPNVLDAARLNKESPVHPEQQISALTLPTDHHPPWFVCYQAQPKNYFQLSKIINETAGNVCTRFLVDMLSTSLRKHREG